MSQLGSYDTTLRMRHAFRWLPRAVDTFGEQALFYGQSIRYMPLALRRYRKETLRLIAEMTLGSGALLLIGGTVGVAAFLTLASGGVIAVQGYESLGNIGIEALTGFLSAFSTCESSRRSSQALRSPPPSALAPPPNSAQCA